MTENNSENKTSIIMNLLGKFKSEEGSKFLEILPFFLIIGILYQFTNLVLIDKLIFFSWSQVINDTIALFFPVLFGILGFLIGNTVETNGTHKNFWISLIISIMIFAVIFLMLFGIKVPYSIYESLVAGYIMNIFSSMFIYIRISTGSEKMKDKGMIFILKIFVGIFILFFLFSHFRDSQYKNLYIKIEDKYEHILYMNDQYIFTKDTILHNREDLIFNYTVDNKKQ